MPSVSSEEFHRVIGELRRKNEERHRENSDRLTTIEKTLEAVGHVNESMVALQTLVREHADSDSKRFEGIESSVKHNNALTETATRSADEAKQSADQTLQRINVLGNKLGVFPSVVDGAAKVWRFGKGFWLGLAKFIAQVAGVFVAAGAIWAIALFFLGKAPFPGLMH